MVKIKFCGMMRPEDIAAVKALRPDFAGFVFAPRSRRCLSGEQAARLKALLPEDIPAVGVFVDEDPGRVAGLLSAGIIDIAQLHGKEDERYLAELRALTDKPVIRAFQIRSRADLAEAKTCTADYLLLDAGAGSGTTFEWSWLQDFPRPYFLAGGLSPENVGDAVRRLRPFGVDVSSGIETDGRKDPEKMRAFLEAARRA